MIPYPSINPDIVRVGPFAVRWYGLMYVLGFGASYALVRRQIKQRNLPLTREFLDSFYTFLVVGLIVGARLGYALFYNFSWYVHNPIDLVALWKGGMSFHGGLIGSALAGLWCCRRYRADPWLVADLVTVTAPIGLGLGRIGNFINAELYGRVTTLPWGMVFPGGGPSPRHPSQLYECFLEGVLLFCVLWSAKERMPKTGMVTALFLLLYSICRFLVEFVREPDPQLGFVAGPFTMGQILSAGMALAGVALLYLRSTRGKRT